MPPSLPSAVYRIVPKQGKADCAIACLAMLLRRDYGEVLAAAARISRTLWTAGLTTPEMIRVARRLKSRLVLSDTIDPEEDTGILWVTFRDRAGWHVVLLHQGLVFDPEHDPVSMWDYEAFCAVQNAVPKGILKETNER